MPHVYAHHENAGINPLPIFQRFGMITNPDGGPPLQWNSSLSLSLCLDVTVILSGFHFLPQFQTSSSLERYHP